MKISENVKKQRKLDWELLMLFTASTVDIIQRKERIAHLLVACKSELRPRSVSIVLA